MIKQHSAFDCAATSYGAKQSVVKADILWNCDIHCREGTELLTIVAT
jgi:hypothetical protein